jgi:carbamate kinase
MVKLVPTRPTLLKPFFLIDSAVASMILISGIGDFPRSSSKIKCSMAPKVEVTIRSVESGAERAIIAELANLAEAIESRTGTHVIMPRG